MTTENPDHSPLIALVGPDFGELARELRLALPHAEHWRLLRCDDGPHLMGLSEPAPDLVVLQDPGTDGPLDELFEHARTHWPRSFFLLVTPRARVNLNALFREHGVMPVAPPEPGALCEAVGREVANLSRGSLSGLSLPGLLQMMAWERKSLAIRVQAGQRWGRLHLDRGEVVDAYVHQAALSGEQAAYEILAWEQVSMTLERSYRNQHHVIGQPLTALLMEAMRRKDETTVQEAFSIEDLLLEDQPPEDRPEEDMFRRNRRVGPGSRETASEPRPTLPEHAEPNPPIQVDFEATTKETIDMANVKDTLDAALHNIDGAMAAALVDYSSGMALGTVGSGVNLEVAAAGNTEVVRAKLRTMSSLGIQGSIEDILITLDKQYHIIYLIPGQTLFLYLVLNRDQANLAMARFKIKGLGSEIKI